MASRRFLPIVSILRRQTNVLSNHIARKQQSLKSSHDELEEYVEVKKNPFSPVTSDHKSFLEELRPPVKRSFNLAAHVNQSKSLQKLVSLGVSLYDVENVYPSVVTTIMSLDFDKDCMPAIRFLLENGVKDDRLGYLISDNPLIFFKSLDELQCDIDYLKSKNFTKKLLAQLLNNSTRILTMSPVELDNKLGVLQIEFNMIAQDLRKMLANRPTILLPTTMHYKVTKITLKEEFGFEEGEMRYILLKQPSILELHRSTLIERLDLLHNTIGLSHETIARTPKLITAPRLDVEYRALYLKKLKRDQFDSKQPLYVPPEALFQPSDEEFCSKYAKTDVNDYKLFIKSR